jgi:hypothetical protein
MAIQPTITGTLADQETTQNETIGGPGATNVGLFDVPVADGGPVVITTNPGGVDTVDINLTNTGGPLGTLSTGLGTGLLSQVAGSPGDWTLVGSAATIETDLHDLIFHPAGLVNTIVTTTFAIKDTSSVAPAVPSAVDSTTTVRDAVTGPTITGIIPSQATTNGAHIPLFSGVTVADSAGTGTDTNTLVVTLSAPNGTLSGLGALIGGNHYDVTGTAAVITAALDGSEFTPTVGVLGSITPTVFSLVDTSTGAPTLPATSTTRVTNTVPTSSILFQSTATGQPSVWQLDGMNLIGGTGPVTAQNAPTVPLDPGLSWTVVGTGAFSATDPAVTSSILWQSSNGQVAAWEMNGNNEVSAGLTTVAGASVNPGTSWKAIGTGDFTGAAPGADRDILLQNTGGEVAIWNMAGSAITASGFANVGGVTASPGPNWEAIGSGDFLAGAHAGGIVLQNTSTSNVAIWNMGGIDGTTVESSGLATVAGVTATPGTNWKVVGTGDFTGTGKNDIILQNSATSEVAIWDMTGNAITGSGLANVGGVTATPGLDWKAIGSGGVGDSAILFQNTTSGQTAIWDMGGADGTHIISSGLTSINGGPTLKAVSLT